MADVHLTKGNLVIAEEVEIGQEPEVIEVDDVDEDGDEIQEFRDDEVELVEIETDY